MQHLDILTASQLNVLSDSELDARRITHDKQRAVLCWQGIPFLILGLAAGTWLIHACVEGHIAVGLFLPAIALVLYGMEFGRRRNDEAGAHLLARDSLAPLSHLDPTLCERALHLVTYSPGAKAWRDKVVTQARELRHFDLQVMERCAAHEMAELRRTGPRALCRKLHLGA
jgi:hypothetical protein